MTDETPHPIPEPVSPEPASVEPVLSETAPEHAATGHPAPEHSATEHPAPEHSVPEHSVPEHSVPEHSVPEHPAREYAAPERIVAAAPAPTRGLWAAIVVLAVVLIVGGYVLWSSLQGGDTQGLQQVQASLADLNGRIAKLEARPAPAAPPPPPNLTPLQDGIADVQRKVAALDSKPAPDLTPLQQGLSALGAKVTALENKPPPQASLDDATRQALAGLSGRIDTVTAREDELGTTEQADVGKLSQEVTALDARVAAGVKSSSELAALAQQQSRTSQLQAAGVALEAGRPLGDIPGAPPALAKFATQAPPTEASLRLSFDAAAQAAHEAGQPPPGSMPLLDRMWQRAQASVTVKQGNKVVVGDRLSDTLEQARHLLDNGDLAGAVTALNALSGPAAEAMAPWKAQAQSLLDARAALIQTAHG